MAAGQETCRRQNVDRLPEPVGLPVKAMAYALAGGSLDAERAGEHLGGRRRRLGHQRHPVEAAYRVLARHLAIRPAGNFRCILCRDQREPHPVRIAQGQNGFTEPLLGRVVINAALDQPLRPIAERSFGNDERGLDRHAVAVAARRRLPPREESQSGARPTSLVAVVQVPGGGVVEVDGLLDHAQTERAGVERDVPLGVAANRRHMVDARTPAHGALSLSQVVRYRYCAMWALRGPRTIPRDATAFSITAATLPYGCPVPKQRRCMIESNLAGLPGD